jgi:hypothetical protein
MAESPSPPRFTAGIQNWDPRTVTGSLPVVLDRGAKPYKWRLAGFRGLAGSGERWEGHPALCGNVGASVQKSAIDRGSLKATLVAAAVRSEGRQQ